VEQHSVGGPALNCRTAHRCKDRALPRPCWSPRPPAGCRRHGDEFLKPNQRLNTMLQRILRADYNFPAQRQLRCASQQSAFCGRQAGRVCSACKASELLCGRVCPGCQPAAVRAPEVLQSAAFFACLLASTVKPPSRAIAAGFLQYFSCCLSARCPCCLLPGSALVRLSASSRASPAHSLGHRPLPLLSPGRPAPHAPPLLARALPAPFLQRGSAGPHQPAVGAGPNCEGLYAGKCRQTSTPQQPGGLNAASLAG